MFNLMDLASKYLDIDKLTAGLPGMSRSYSKSESSDGSYVLKKSRRRKKKKPKNKKKIVIIKKKLQIPEPPKIIIIPQRVKRVKTSKSSVAKHSSTSARSAKKPVKSHSEKSRKKDLDKKSSMPGQKGDTKKRSKKSKSNSSTVQKALKDFKKKKSQFLESLKLLQQHLSNMESSEDEEKLESIKSSSSGSSSCVLSEKEIPKIEPLPEPPKPEIKTLQFQKPKEFEFYKLYEPKPIDKKILETRIQRVNKFAAKTIFKSTPKVQKKTKNADEILKNSTRPFIIEVSDSESQKTDGCRCNIKNLKNNLPQCTVYGVKAADFLKNSKDLKNKERPKMRKDVYQKSASESDVKVAKVTKKTVQNEKIQKTVPFRKEFSEFSSNNLLECPPEATGDTNIEEAVAVFPYEVCQIGFLENAQVENENGMKLNVNEIKFDDENMEEIKKIDGNKRLDSIVKTMKGMLPKCTVYRGRQ